MWHWLWPEKGKMVGRMVSIEKIEPLREGGGVETTTIRTEVYGWEDAMIGRKMFVGMTKIEGRFSTRLKGK